MSVLLFNTAFVVFLIGLISEQIAALDFLAGGTVAAHEHPPLCDRDS